MPTEDTISSREEALVREFNFFDDWMGKYEYLIELAGDMPEIDPQYKDEEHRIRGCQAKVWVHATMKDGGVYYAGDSDAMITKGLVALLIRVLNGQPPQAIADADLSFLDEVGMQEHLSPSRKNGLAAMVRQMKLFAVSHGQTASS